MMRLLTEEDVERMKRLSDKDRAEIARMLGGLTAMFKEAARELKTEGG